MSTQHLTRRYRHAALAGAALTLVLTGCQSDSNERDEGTKTPNTSATPTETDTTADTSWQEQYTDEQLQAYQGALQRLTDYEETSEPIWREGRVTPEAEALMASYWLDGGAQQLSVLATYEQNDIQISGLPTVLSSEATFIAEEAGSGSVTIDQCLDWSTSAVTQRGTAAPTPDAVLAEQRRTVELGRTGDAAWQIVYINTYDGTEPC